MSQPHEPRVIVIGASMAGAAAADQPMSQPNKPRVIIIGAGMAGAAAADQLREVADVIVLEAKNRTGGRTWTDHFSGGEFVDLGAAWVHGTIDNPAGHLFKRFGVEISDSFETVPSLVEAGGIVGGPPDTVQQVSMSNLAFCRGLGLYKMNTAFEAANKKYGELGADKDVSIETVLDELKSSGCLCGFQGFDAYPERQALFMRGIIELLATASSGCHPRALGAHFSFNEANLPDALPMKGNAMGVPVGGWQQVCDGLLQGIEVRLEVPVRAIRMQGEEVEVELRSGEVVRGAACICTVPLGVLKAGTIAFSPPLPASKLDSLSKLEMGQVNRIAVKFDKNFWSGRMAKMLTRIPVTPGRREAAEQTSIEFGTWCDWSQMVGSNILVTFYYADYAEKAEKLSDEVLLEHYLAICRSMFPKQEVDAANILEYKITRWGQDEFAFGAYSGAGVGSDLQDRVELQKAHGRIHFAGEHVAMKGTSASVHGAYLSGVEAAREVGAYIGTAK